MHKIFYIVLGTLNGKTDELYSFDNYHDAINKIDEIEEEHRYYRIEERIVKV